jgi:hypothetical protein
VALVVNADFHSIFSIIIASRFHFEFLGRNDKADLMIESAEYAVTYLTRRMLGVLLHNNRG